MFQRLPDPTIMLTTLTRTIRFHATHAYGRAEWTSERNTQVFGANVEAHSHEYVVSVSVRGIVDSDTGFIVDLVGLDELLESEVRSPLDGHHLNDVVEEFRSGRMQPSTEALAQVFWGRLESRIPGGAVLECVRVAESPELASEVRRGD